MDRPALLVLVRHAESARNVARKGNIFFADDESRAAVRGVPDFETPLTDEGRRQAIETGRVLRERFGVFDHVYHSGYERTVATADLVTQAYGADERARVRVHLNAFIRERDSGYAFDMTTAEAEAAFPWLHEYWRTAGSFFARPPGGESVADVCERVYLFLNMLFRDRAGERILAVTHGVALRAFRFLLERWDYSQAGTLMHEDPPHNCSVTTYAYDGAARRLVLREYNRVYWT